MSLPRIRSPQELLRLAVALERRASERFNRIAGAMETRGRADLAALFRRLAAEETDHAAALLVGSDYRIDDAEGDILPPELLQTEALPDADRLARASVYQCLADAVRSEEQAFQFFAYVAAHATEPRLRRLAESLAQEELRHAADLRMARRQAYRRQDKSRSEWPDPSTIGSQIDLVEAALPVERRLARDIRKNAASDAGQETLLAATEDILRLLDETAAGNIADTPATDSDTKSPADGNLKTRFDLAFEFYDAVADGAKDETLLLLAQNLSQSALTRLQLISAADGDATAPQAQ